MTEPDHCAECDFVTYGELVLTGGNTPERRQGLRRQGYRDSTTHSGMVKPCAGCAAAKQHEMDSLEESAG